ncbi:caldesmon, partial [Antrostomus carolinensis]|uniref:caldesmon n=1 Tax=Antrostomus carolinensis TaxID=279965 RepID=UPI00052851A4
LSYQRNDDDEEEAARERRRRARQERLRQKDDDLSGEVTEKSEVNAQNSVGEEESKRTRGTDDEAALLERLARREERRQKRLQEALERQKEFDPTITDGSLSLPSRREVNNVEENETTEKEEKAETRRGRYEIEETDAVTKSYQKNNWRQDGEEEEKKEEKAEEVQEEKPKEVPVEENQVDVTAEKSTDKEEGVETKNLGINAEEHKAENDTNAVLEGEQSITDAVDKEKLRDEEERKKAEEREKLEAEERERLKAEEEKKAAEEKQKAEEEKRAAEERERAKAEEEKRAAEERERAKAEEKKAAEERAKAKAEEEKRAAEERAKAKAEEEKRAAEEKAKLEAEKLKEKQKMEEKKLEDKQVKEKKVQEEKPQAAFLRKKGEEKEVKVEAKKEKLPDEKLRPTSQKDQVKDDKDKGKAPRDEMKSIWDRKRGVAEQKAQNGERELAVPKLKPAENAFGRSNLKGTANAEEAKLGSQVDQRRRRGENEDFEKLKEKQQEAAAELDELKKRREERRKILEEEEQKKKQEEAERKAREEEEKRRMKEEIERRRAEAAEKRQKMPEDGVSEDKKPFKCFSPKGSSLKIEERAEFLNKSAQKSGLKPTHTTAVVSKIDSRLEQYTSAIEGTKAARPAKPAASDLPVPAEGVRNIKSMWEKGNVFSSPSGTGTPNKETAGLKVGVSSRINEWLTKTPESNKSPAPKPSDLKPGDVSSKRNLWEKQSVEKPSSSSKVSALGKKSETNAGLRQFEKEP